MGRKERVRVCHPSGGPMLTKQSEKDLTDVNLIMDSWIHAGAAVAGHLNPAMGAYGDFSSGIDYHAALDAVLDAQSCFAALDPRIRSHVENDPGQFLDMVFDPERRDELERLGLVPKAKPVEKPVEKRVEEPVKAPVVDPKDPAEVPSGEAGGGEAKRVDAAAGLFD